MGFFSLTKKKDPSTKESSMTDPSIAVTGKEELLDPNDPENGDPDISIQGSMLDDITSRIPNLEIKSMMAAVAAKWAALSPAVKYGVMGVTGAALLLWVYSLAGVPTKKVAFIGNSYIMVNDLPRLVQSMSKGSMIQDSCLHPSGSVLNILKTGNGMAYTWNTQNAMVGGREFQTSDGSTTYLYDMGACSVPKLLTGRDNLLSYENQDGHYINDGSNPCFENSYYLEEQFASSNNPRWDYVVISDQSKRMAIEEARSEALLGFNYTFGPLLKKGSAKPILVQPHAYHSYSSDMTGIDTIPDFTHKILEGAKVYSSFLNKKLSLFQNSRIARVGDAFLAVYYDNQEMWSKLFLDDGIHPSGYGSFLYGAVIYATIYKKMPPKRNTVTDDVEGNLFGMSRLVQASSFPTKSEADYLYKIARKVALRGYKPRSGKSSGYNAYVEEEQEEEQEQYAGDDAYAAAGDDAYAAAGDDAYAAAGDDANAAAGDDYYNGNN